MLIERYVSQARLLLQRTYCNLVPTCRCFCGASVSLDFILVLHQVVHASLRVHLGWVKHLRGRLRLVVI
jgi:hypothetical protein